MPQSESGPQSSRHPPREPGVESTVNRGPLPLSGPRKSTTVHCSLFGLDRKRLGNDAMDRLSRRCGGWGGSAELSDGEVGRERNLINPSDKE